MKEILVGSDTSASADLAVEAAAELAGSSGAGLVLRHAPCSVLIVDTRAAP